MTETPMEGLLRGLEVTLSMTSVLAEVLGVITQTLDRPDLTQRLTDALNMSADVLRQE